MLKLFKQNKMFRVFLTYQFFSSIGSAMFSMFILLSVHLLYGNPIYTGIAGFLMAAPHVVSFAVGPIVDRRNKVAIMRLTTFLEFLVLALLAFTPLQEHLGIPFMFVVIFAYSIAALFEVPAGTALLPQIVQEEDILQANSLINIVAMAGGIAIGAILFTTLAGDVNFSFLYGFSAVFIALAFVFALFLRNPATKETAEQSQSSSYLKDLKEGAKFIRGNVLLFILITTVMMNFVGEITYVNRPMFLEYYVGAQGYVLFTMAALVGGVLASSFVGALGKKFKIGNLVFMLLIFSGIARVVFTLLVPIHLISSLATMVIYAALGTAAGIVFSSLNQKIPPKDMVGRVATISTTFNAIAVALGAFAGGFLGSVAPSTGHIFIYHGISLLVIGVLIISIPSIRKLPKMNEIKKSED